MHVEEIVEHCTEGTVSLFSEIVTEMNACRTEFVCFMVYVTESKKCKNLCTIVIYS